MLSAFCLATADAISKKSLAQANVRPPGEEVVTLYLVAWARLLYASPWLMLLLLFIDIPPLDRTFWLTIVAMVPLELLALVLYVKALQASPLSLSLPFLSLTPVFLVGTSAIMLGEVPSVLGSVGIALVVLGALLLHARQWRESVWQPLRLIWQEPGSRYMIAVAFLYSLTSNLGKQAILHSSPVFFGAAYFLILSLAFAPFVMAVVGWRGLPSILRKEFAAIGGFEAVMIVTHALAIIQTNVSYMIAVKRTSVLFGLAYGAWWFGERHLAERISGASVMLLGVICTVAG